MGTTSGFGRARRAAVLMTAAVTLAAGMLVGSGPVHAAGAGEVRTADHESMKAFVSKPFEITRNGVTYDVQVYALRFGRRDQMLQISLTQSQERDGVLVAARGLGYAGPTRLVVDDRFASGGVKTTAAQLAGRGAIDLTWNATQPMRTRCDGQRKIRGGELTGTFVFDTQVPEIGRIRRSRLAGTMRNGEGPCDMRGDFSACPKDEISYVGGREDLMFGAFKRARQATVFAMNGYFSEADWSPLQFVWSDLPAANVKVDKKMQNGKIVSAPGTYLQGAATFSSTKQKKVYRDRCRPGKQAVSELNGGKLSRGLRADFLVGGPADLYGPTTVYRLSTRDI
jgi:hypothetical protein